MAAYKVLCQALQDYNVSVRKLKEFNMTTKKEPSVWQWIDRPDSTFNTSLSSLNELSEAAITPLSFPVRYLLEVCISQGQLDEHNLDESFVNQLSTLNPNKALDILQHVAEQKTRIYDPKTIFHLKHIRPSTSAVQIPHYCVYTRKATVTPTMIYFSTPTVETSNRVVRHYIEHSDRFLRVQFTDEKFQVSKHPPSENNH